MRVLILAIGFVIGCGAVSAQTTPVNMGLWDVRATKKTTLSPALDAVRKQKGDPVQAPVMGHWHTCKTEAEWKRADAAVNKAPQGCVFVNKTQNTHGYSSRQKCEVQGGVHILIEADISWETRDAMHSLTRMTTTYPDRDRVYITETKSTSHFLGADCGSVAPNTSAPAQ